MNKLMAVIAEFALELHPDRIAVIASIIETMVSVEEFDSRKIEFWAQY